MTVTPSRSYGSPKTALHGERVPGLLHQLVRIHLNLLCIPLGMTRQRLRYTTLERTERPRVARPGRPRVRGGPRRAQTLADSPIARPFRKIVTGPLSLTTAIVVDGWS